MTTKTVEYIQPPNNLRNKQKLAGVSMTLDGKSLDNAEAIIRSSTDNYIVSIGEDLAKLQKQYDAAVAEPEQRPLHVENMHAVLQSISGQGSSFGYELMTALANQVAYFIEDHVFPIAATRPITVGELEVIKVHMEAMRLVIQQKMEGDGGAMGQKLVAGLGLVIKKVTTPAG